MNSNATTQSTANSEQLKRTAATLPVTRALPKILKTIEENQVTILVGQTCSEETTQVPQALSRAYPSARIALTQNRVLAAKMVAARLADELGAPLGGDVVGLRNRDCVLSTKSTRLTVMTDGLLLAIAKGDSALSDFSIIIVDEAHQHTTPTDLVLGRLKVLAKDRDDLKVVIMSATIDTELFCTYFDNAAVEIVEGREHGVDVCYLPSLLKSQEDTIVDTILKVHLTEQSGDILVFVPGTNEAHKAVEGDSASFRVRDIGPLVAYELYSQLPLEMQDEAVYAVAPAGSQGKFGRKLLVATNIAETSSITFVGVTHVIDSCREKMNVWNPRGEYWKLHDLWSSKAVASQRSGRAGRTSRGKAYRMTTEYGFHSELSEHSVAAIQTTDMLSECLDILTMGADPRTFPYIVPPATETIVKALGILHELGCVNGSGKVTEHGEAISRFPMSVYSATALLYSNHYECVDEIMTIVAMIESSDGGQIFRTAVTPKERKEVETARSYFRHDSGDHLTLFNIYMAWRQAGIDKVQDAFVEQYKLRKAVLVAADNIRVRLLKILVKRPEVKISALLPGNKDYYTTILTALASANFLRVAKHVSGNMYQTVRGGTMVELAPETKLKGDKTDWVFYELMQATKEGKKVMRISSCIAPELLLSAAPNYWAKVEDIPDGHVKDALLKVLVGMTGLSEADMRGGMPAPRCKKSKA